jgi:hypothetical protein
MGGAAREQETGAQMDTRRANHWRPPTERRPALTLVAATGRLVEDSRTRGRAWVNGREVGGPDARFAHLGRSHD